MECQLTSKVFALLCTMLAVKHLKITAYHRQTNGYVERYNSTKVTRLQHYVAKKQRIGTRASINVRMQHTGIQAHIPNPFQSCVIVTPAWVNNNFPAQEVPSYSYVNSNLCCLRRSHHCSRRTYQARLSAADTRCAVQTALRYQKIN